MLEIALIILILAGIGAIFGGGNSFGDSVRKGCGCVVMILLVLLALSFFGLISL